MKLINLTYTALFIYNDQGCEVLECKALIYFT